MANKEKWCFIVNPTAGGGSGKELIPQLKEQLARRSLNADILVTERHNHAIELSKRCLEGGCTHIIAVGGDGTISSRDKQQESDCFINTISVGRRFAGSFFLTPNAIANDGLLDVCMISKLNLLQRFKILSMVPKGTHVRDKKVDYYQTEKISIDFGKKVPFHVDGELYFDTTFEVSLLPSALNIIYNPEGKHFFNE